MAALNGGPDAALVVEMVERVRPPVRLPTQVVTPVPQKEETSEGETSEEESVTPGQSPPRQENQTPPQETRDTGNTDTVILIEDSDSDRD